MLQSGHKYDLRHLIALPYRAAPVAAALRFALAACDAAMPAAKVFITASFLDTAMGVVSGRMPESAIFMPLTLLVLMVALEWLSGNAKGLLDMRMQLSLRLSLRADIIDKQARLQYAHIENADTWDLISRVAKDPETRIRDGYTGLLNAAGLALSFASIFAVIVLYAWWAALLLLALIVPMALISLKGGKKQYEADQEATKFSRRHEYLSEVMHTRENVEERSLFGYAGRVVEQFRDHYMKARRIRLRMSIRWMSRSKAMSMATVLVTLPVLFALLMQVVSGVMSVGTYIALLEALTRITTSISWSLSMYSDQIAKNREYMKELTRFMALAETPGATAEPARGVTLQSLRFENVRFKYPGTERYVLDGVSFTIERGRHYSFVGANGAGKTTLAKLITGLYGDYEGEIRVNDRDIRDMPLHELKAYAACIFQDFAKYQIALRDNIAMGCLGAEDAEARVARALDAVELGDVVAKLPLGLAQPLGKIEAEGQDISGGQWQRVALARAVASPAPLRILDEPTAALDPISESAVYSQFEKISQGMTTVFISHRLGSTKLADCIFVLDGGKIRETGTHEQLMARHGLYAEMYDSQRSWYQ